MYSEKNKLVYLYKNMLADFLRISSIAGMLQEGPLAH